MNDENKKFNIKSLIKILILGSIIILFYARFIGTNGLIVNEYGITDSNLPASFNGLKIVHLSDIHYGTTINNKKLNKIVEEVNNIKPDIIVFTGDLYDESLYLNDEVKNELINTLKKLNASMGKYAVIGNHDYCNNLYEEIITNSDFIYLKNDSKIIYNKDNEAVEIIGFDDAIKGNVNYNINLSNNYKIALMHEPDEIDKITSLNINLVLAGHSHGGQIRIPIIGSLYTPNGAKKYTDEYYNVSNTNMYISYGLGTSILKLRFFTKPSINLYRLYN